MQVAHLIEHEETGLVDGWYMHKQTAEDVCEYLTKKHGPCIVKTVLKSEQFYIPDSMLIREHLPRG